MLQYFLHALYFIFCVCANSIGVNSLHCLKDWGRITKNLICSMKTTIKQHSRRFRKSDWVAVLLAITIAGSIIAKFLKIIFY